MIITSDSLSRNLVFIALYIALYESLCDYIVDCPKQLLNGERMVSAKCTSIIKETNMEYEKQRKEAIEYLKHCDRSKHSADALKRIEALAKNGYKQQPANENGFILWSSPMYQEIICKRKLNVQEKNQSMVLLNSLMFFVDFNAITSDEFNKFLEIRTIRGMFVHEMEKLIIQDVKEKYQQSFDELVSLYMKLNNFWSTEFELSICGDDIPTNIEIDYSGVITVDLYNLFLSVDTLLGTNYVAEKSIRILTGLYNTLALPVRSTDEQEERPND